MNKKTQGVAYKAPFATVIVLEVEQCLAASVGDTLQDMDKNEIYDEEF